MSASNIPKFFSELILSSGNKKITLSNMNITMNPDGIELSGIRSLKYIIQSSNAALWLVRNIKCIWIFSLHSIILPSLSSPKAQVSEQASKQARILNDCSANELSTLGTWFGDISRLAKTDKYSETYPLLLTLTLYIHNTNTNCEEKQKSFESFYYVLKNWELF
jgi:hypothetical protein